ncbi:MAG TPA: DUF1929 domain-containing protein [Candidatus Aquabacterium excrementipullorum]|nr:DUF1929 domain-containing protein [Candidatus Aquabacterium excrementipullorum]
MAQRSPARRLASALSAVNLFIGLTIAAAVPSAQAAWDSYTKGSMGPVVNWPLIPIHVVLLPDGRLMSYGTDAKGNQTGQFIYDVWDPKLGTGTNAHLVLPNTTGTDTFCSAQVIVPSSGAVLLTGGDKAVNGTRNYSVNDVNLFDYRSSALYQAAQPMRDARWYPTVVTLSSGQILVLGGRASPTELSVPTPELYTDGLGWRSLTGATSDDAYGARNWSYPRAWQAPNGKVFVMTIWGGTYYLDPTGNGGNGSIAATPLTVPTGDVYLPSVMYAPGKILALRQFNRALVVDINGAQPTSTTVTGVGQDRYHGSATVLADGKVYVNGGSIWSNVAFGVAYAGKIWDPATRQWTATDSAKKMRLYHSVSLLLPDATVLTAGGGAPGPATNLNAEIYTPPYLYKKDWTGTLATRPSITNAPTATTWKQSFKVDVSATGISRVTLVKTGSATHTVDFDQRFLPLDFSASGKTLTVTAPSAAEIAPPGYYMLFVFDSAGVPSVARILKLG